MVVAKNATITLHGVIAGKIQRHEVLFYNLDVIISVGYRDKSKRGTQFRIWANSVLKDYLIKGYAVRNDFAQQKYDDLKALVDVMGRTTGYLDSPADDQIKSIFDVVKDYTYALDTLDSYDYQTLSIRSTSKECFHATYENAIEVINDLKAKFGESSLFGNEKDQSFRSSIGQIYQTWDGIDRNGTLAIITNSGKEPKDVYVDYKSRCNVETMIDTFKNVLDIDHSYMQDEHALEGWMFSNYIALHWYYKIYQLLARTDLISRYSPMDIIDFLQETRKIKIDGQWYLKEATAKTAKVLKKMGLDLK